MFLNPTYQENSPRHLVALAYEGNPEAQHKLGKIFFNARKVSQNSIIAPFYLERAIHYFTLAKNNQNQEASADLERCNLETNGSNKKKFSDCISNTTLPILICDLSKNEQTKKNIIDLTSEHENVSRNYTQALFSENMCDFLFECFDSDIENKLGCEYTADLNTAIRALTELASQGNQEAQYILSLYNKENREFKEAIRLWLEFTERGNGDAQYKLGFGYLNGNKVKKNIDKAIMFLTWAISINRDHSDALYALGLCYYNKQDIQKSIELWTESAKKGNTNAINKLALLHYNGEGLEKNLSKAMELWRKSGDALAEYYLGVCYFQKKAYTQAIHSWDVSAKKNNPDAAFSLGVCYYEGYGVLKNVKTALNLWNHALSINFHHPDTLSCLGWCYYSGEGVKQDVYLAISYWEISAKKEHRNALYFLGKCYLEGIYFKKNYEKAIELLTLSLNRQNSNNFLKPQISQSQISELLRNAHTQSEMQDVMVE